jgi:NAD(P)-dependent dehydrogenase (short-subunit alcohol dehydrogenase family)
VSAAVVVVLLESLITTPAWARLQKERRGALAREITDGGGRAHFVELDVVDQEQ